MSSPNHRQRLRLSISMRLTLWYGLTVLILLSLLAIFSYTNFHLNRHRDFDQHLAHEIRELLPFLYLEGEHPIFVNLDRLRSVAFQTHGLQSTYVRLISPDGDLLYRSPNFLAHPDLPVELPDGPHEMTISREWDGNPARTVYKPLMTSDDVLRGWLEVTGFEWSLHEQLSRLRRGLIAGIALSVLLALIAGYMLARRALQPVVALTHAANEIRATDLSARLPIRSGVRDELSDLAETFNTMLQRLQNSFERERRFSDNAAHELLTPLATLANRTEIALRRGRTAEAYEKTLREILVDIEELTDTVRGLLQLSRAERLKEIPKEPVDLRLVADRCVKRFTSSAGTKNQRLTLEMNGDVVVEGKAQQLGEVIDNLLDNAVKYTPEGGHIRVKVHEEADQAVVQVADSGVGFTEEEGRHLFDRFYRADNAATRSLSGSGLGLAIVESIVKVFGGDFSAHSEGLGQGSVFEVRFPKSPRS